MSESHDDRFALLLSEYDDLLQASSATQSAKPTPAGQDARLRDAQEFLQLLEARWPRGNRRMSAEAGLPETMGRFSIRRVLGQGGTGIVYLAHDPVLGREVALKVPRLEVVLTPERRRRFLREAQAAALLNHPNITPIYEVSEAGNLCFIVYSYCPGPSLAQWLQNHTEPLRCTDVARLVKQLAETIEHAHQRGILHRDLKPANILLDFGVPETSGTQASGASFLTGEYQTEIKHAIPKVTDFGLAKVVLNDTDITQSGLLLGTPAYMAPEQTHGVKEIGPACDIWALGVILYELLARQRPFLADTPLTVMHGIQHSEPASLRLLRADVPRDLEAICSKCLEKKPARRYRTAAELTEDLGRFLENKPTKARPLGLLAGIVKGMRRHPIATALVSLIVVGLLFAVAEVTWRSQELVAHNLELQAAAQREKHLANKAREAQARAEERERRVRLQAYVASVSVADRYCKEKRFALARSTLSRHLAAADDDLRDFSWRYLWQLCEREMSFTRAYSHPAVSVGFSADGQRLYSASVRTWLECHDSLSGSRLLAQILATK